MPRQQHGGAAFDRKSKSLGPDSKPDVSPVLTPLNQSNCGTLGNRTQNRPPGGQKRDSPTKKTSQTNQNLFSDSESVNQRGGKGKQERTPLSLLHRRNYPQHDPHFGTQESGTRTQTNHPPEAHAAGGADRALPPSPVVPPIDLRRTRCSGQPRNRAASPPPSELLGRRNCRHRRPPLPPLPPAGAARRSEGKREGNEHQRRREIDRGRREGGWVAATLGERDTTVYLEREKRERGEREWVLVAVRAVQI